ncbi:metallophosphoesterase [Tsukamurella tyrosinosolvens]|nr:metallophosphoesterase [Tsukamurella tyrosinosolvens]
MAAAGAPAVLGVYGNHCTADYMPAAGIVDLVGDRSSPAKVGQLQLPDGSALRVLAVQGCVRYKPDLDDVLFTQNEYAAALRALPGADLVITHCPPAGINDAPDPAHVGIVALREWVDLHRPRWLLHGHTYENPARHLYGQTEVLYVSGCAVVDLELSGA